MPRNQKLLPFGLKHNPFSPDIPIEACLRTPAIETFCWRTEHLAREGGFAMVTGGSGVGKSVALRILEHRLKEQPDVDVAVLTRPQCSVADFYRELGVLFGVELRPHNRWSCAQQLRERWQEHIHAALLRPTLLVDEAQEMKVAVLNELRLLSTARLDSQRLLTVVLAGDERLRDKFRHRDLRPLESRLRVRLQLEGYSPEELLRFLDHALAQAGNPKLITAEILRTLCERAAGNLRTLMNHGDELLDAAVRSEARQIDEKLFFATFQLPAPSGTPSRKRPAASQQRSLIR
jgi:general secretion pathway protein A